MRGIPRELARIARGSGAALRRKPSTGPDPGSFRKGAELAGEGRFEPVQRSIDGKLEARSVLSSGPDQQ